MKLNALLALLATTSAVSAVNLPPRAEPEPKAEGLYHTFLDESGNRTIEFTPLSELAAFANEILPASLGERSTIEKRRQGCGASVIMSDCDEANRRLLESVSSSDTVYMDGGHGWSLTYGRGTSYICAYSGGYKFKADIAGNWNWVKTILCGYERGGYAQVIGGQGDWTAGYTYNGDGFCW